MNIMKKVMCFQAPINVTELARQAQLPYHVFVAHDAYEMVLARADGGNPRWDLMYALREALGRARAWSFKFSFYRQYGQSMHEIKLTVTHPTPHSLYVALDKPDTHM